MIAPSVRRREWLMWLAIFHPWYRLPLVPVAAALAGLSYNYTMQRLAFRRRWRAILCSACCLFFVGLAYLSYRAVAPLYEAQRPWLWSVGRALQRSTPPEALVVVADDGDPRAIYYSRRKGWHFLQDGLLKGYPHDAQDAIATLERLRSKGASYFAFPQQPFWRAEPYRGFEEHLEARYRPVHETSEYVIVDLLTPTWDMTSSNSGPTSAPVPTDMSDW